MKTFVLLKDLPGVKAGTEFTTTGYLINVHTFGAVGIMVDASKHPDWFEPKETRWKPEEGKRYFSLMWQFGPKVVEQYRPYDPAMPNEEWMNKELQENNVFQTEEQAQEASNRIKSVLEEYHKELAK